MINDWAVTSVVNIFFVNSLDHTPDLAGISCGADIFGFLCNGEVGIFIAEQVFIDNRIDTLAHEIGHLLELFHTSDDPDFGGTEPSDNLMTGGGSRLSPTGIEHVAPDGDNLDQLTVNQIATARGSKFVRVEAEIPLPSSLLLFGFGLCTLYGLRGAPGLVMFRAAPGRGHYAVQAPGRTGMP